MLCKRAMYLNWIYLSTSLAIEQVTICTVASYPTLKGLGSDYQDVSEKVQLKWKKVIACSGFTPDYSRVGAIHGSRYGFTPSVCTREVACDRLA